MNGSRSSDTSGTKQVIPRIAARNARGAAMCRVDSTLVIAIHSPDDGRGWQMIAAGRELRRGKSEHHHGSMPHRMCGSVGRKSDATESVTENGPPHVLFGSVR